MAELDGPGCALWMPCSAVTNWPNWQQTARSMHPGGVYAAMGDGSVQFY